MTRDHSISPTASPNLNPIVLPCTVECKLFFGSGNEFQISGFNWVAVKELKLSYYIGETVFFHIYIYIPIMVT